MFDDWPLVNKYFRLSEEINRLMIYKNQVERAFYLQNMATRTEFSEMALNNLVENSRNVYIKMEVKQWQTY